MDFTPLATDLVTAAKPLPPRPEQHDPNRPAKDKAESATGDNRWAHLVVPSYFPAREGNRLTLYHDADVSKEFRPHIELDGGLLWEPKGCWREIYRSICGSKHVIYIGDWGFDERITLAGRAGRGALRQPEPGRPLEAEGGGGRPGPHADLGRPLLAAEPSHPDRRRGR